MPNNMDFFDFLSQHSLEDVLSAIIQYQLENLMHDGEQLSLAEYAAANALYASTTLRFPIRSPFGVRISCSPLLIFSRPPLCWFKFLFSSIQFHLLDFRSFFTFFDLHIYVFYGIIIQKMIEYSIYYKQVVSPCQEENVKIHCIFQIEYLQIQLHIVTAR